MSKRNVQGKSKFSSAPHSVSLGELGAIYAKELEMLQEEIRKKAALASFYKLHPKSRTTVDEFLSEIKQHREIWEQVCSMNIFDFAHAVLRSAPKKSDIEPYERKLSKRTRLNDEQKESLKSLIIDVLSSNQLGLNRQDIAIQVNQEQLRMLQIDRKELPNKLRQPLAELISAGNIYSQGVKRLLKYHVRSADRM